MRGFGDYADDDTASAIKARDHKDATDLIVDNPILIDRAAFNQGINAQYDTHISDDPVTPSLVARGPQPVETTMLSFDTQFGSNANVFEDQTPTLKASQAAPSVAYTLREREGKPGGGKGPLISEEKSGTLAARANDQTIFQPTQTTAFQPGTMIRMSGGVWDELAPTLRAEAKRGDNEPHVAISYDEYNDSLGGDVHHALRAGTKQSTGVVEPTMAVRRLTPVECERLMGWPDDWTGGQADTHRYKQCGNGVASPVAQWIAEQLLQLDKDTHAEETTQENPTT